jgi:hypothetical protein
MTGPLPSYAGATNGTDPPVPPAAAPGDDREPVPVYLTNAVRTSAGPGPGLKYLPPAEAGSLVARRLAVHGETPPRGYLGARQLSKSHRHKRGAVVTGTAVPAGPL